MSSTGVGSMSPPRAAIQRSAEKEPRPAAFIGGAKPAAILTHNLMSGSGFQVDEKKPAMPSHNAAMPHRLSWKSIRDLTAAYCDGTALKAEFIHWTDVFIEAGEDHISEVQRIVKREEFDGEDLDAPTLKGFVRLLDYRQKNQTAFVAARDALLKSKATKATFLKIANSFHANVPDLGPHRGVNNNVQALLHLHFLDTEKGASLSPMSRGLATEIPDLLPPLAVNSGGAVISTTGDAYTGGEMSPRSRSAVAALPTKVVSSFDPDAQFGK
jgi:hypothetical protein